MLPLIFVSVLWAFSFGLIKRYLPNLDPTAVSFVRLALAALVFLPFLRPRMLPRRDVLGLMLIGGIQFGLMYVLYTASYGYLKAHEVALATILTPIYVALLDAAVENKPRWRHFIAAFLAVIGAGVLIWQNRTSDTIITGFLIVQGANLCFAGGQVAYKRIRPFFPAGATDRGGFFWLYLGAVIATGGGSLYFTTWSEFHPTLSQWGVLVYLGMLASGLGFFLWNYGATKVNTGTLAVFNNAKVPLGVICSLLLFQEIPKNVPRLLISLVLLVIAVVVAEWKSKPEKSAAVPSPARK